jgi:hypothetical protein
MKRGKYETIVTDFIPSNPKDWKPDHVELLTCASTIDDLTSRIIRDSQTMSKKFASFADEMTIRGEGWSPTGHSTFRDIEINIAKLEVHKSYIINLIRATLGQDGVKVFREALANATEVAA